MHKIPLALFCLALVCNGRQAKISAAKSLHFDDNQMTKMTLDDARCNQRLVAMSSCALASRKALATILLAFHPPVAFSLPSRHYHSMTGRLNLKYPNPGMAASRCKPLPDWLRGVQAFSPIGCQAAFSVACFSAGILWLDAAVCFIRAAYSLISYKSRSLSWLAIRAATASIALGCVSATELIKNGHVDMRVPLVQFAMVWVAHLLNSMFSNFVITAVRHRQHLFACRGLTWASIGVAAIQIAAWVEMIAHFADKWVYSGISHRSWYNLVFNLGFVWSLACWARALHHSFLTDLCAVATPIVIGLTYFTAPEGQYCVVKSIWQMLASFVYCRAHRQWSKSWCSIFFLAMGASIIHGTVLLMQSGNQWLHVPQSFESIGALLVPIMLTTERIKFFTNKGFFASFVGCLLCFSTCACVHTMIPRVLNLWNLFQGQGPLLVGFTGGQRECAFVGYAALLGAHALGLFARSETRKSQAIAKCGHKKPACSSDASRHQSISVIGSTIVNRMDH